MADILWRLRNDDAYTGTFMQVIDGLIVYGIYDRLLGVSGDGRVVWNRQAASKGLAWFHRLDDHVYVGGATARLFRARDGELSAERDWSSRVQPYQPADDRAIYFREDPATLLALGRDWSVQWEWPDPDEAFTAHGSQVCRYAPDGEMETVDVRTHERHVVRAPAWDRAGYHTHWNGLWCEFSLFGDCLGIDPRTGQVVWHTKDQRAHKMIEYADGVAYAGGGPDGLWAYALDSGAILWRQPFDDPALSLSCHPHLQGDRVYAATTDYRAWVLDRSSGAVIASVEVDVPINPVVPYETDRLIIGSHDEILCVRIGTRA
jgi:PQQ-like domain